MNLESALNEIGKQFNEKELEQLEKFITETEPEDIPNSPTSDITEENSNSSKLPETKTLKKKRKMKVFQRILSGEKTKPRMIVVNEAEMENHHHHIDEKIKPQCCTIS